MSTSVNTMCRFRPLSTSAHIPIFDKPSLSDTASACRDASQRLFMARVKPKPTALSRSTDSEQIYCQTFCFSSLEVDSVRACALAVRVRCVLFSAPSLHLYSTLPLAFFPSVKKIFQLFFVGCLGLCLAVRWLACACRVAPFNYKAICRCIFSH